MQSIEDAINRIETERDAAMAEVNRASIDGRDMDRAKAAGIAAGLRVAANLLRFPDADGHQSVTGGAKTGEKFLNFPVHGEAHVHVIYNHDTDTLSASWTRK